MSSCLLARNSGNQNSAAVPGRDPNIGRFLVGHYGYPLKNVYVVLIVFEDVQFFDCLCQIHDGASYPYHFLEGLLMYRCGEGLLFV